MTELQKRRVQSVEKPIPGCMGRVVNLFDLGSGIVGSRLLTEKAHRDGEFLALPSPGSQLTRSQSDVMKIPNQIQDKKVAYEMKRNPSMKKSDGTPMKMLIAQEMSKEPDAIQKQPSVVARLMGLDAVPAQRSTSMIRGSSPEGYLRNGLDKTGSVTGHQSEYNGFFVKQMPHDIYPSRAYTQEPQECKGMYEVWHESSKTNHSKCQPQQKGRCNEGTNEKRMALVRQKFVEAKRLATDEKLRQSKEFQDALEVLSSNRDLFLKFLQEPNSLVSKHLYELQSNPPPHKARHITVLKPSKTMDLMGEKTVSKQQGVELRDKNKSSWSSATGHPRADNSFSQPTRIVVLKPSPGKALNIKAMGSSPASSPRQLHGGSDFQEFEIDREKGSRVIAKEITHKMQQNVSSSHKEEAFLSSILSNDSVRDEGSFDKSETDCIEEDLSDSDIMTTTSGYSWGCVNRYNSPFSSSSFSRASYSLESSVSREAKKRLSERWAMVASNGSSQEPQQIHRNSNTLGEMLALSEKKKPIRTGENGKDGAPSLSCSKSCGGEQELGALSSCLSNSENKGKGVEDSPKNLLRSKSVPVSSLAYEKVGLNVEVPDVKVSESVGPKEGTKPKSGKSSLRGKVSSLFFSRSKKPSKEKSGMSPSFGYKDGSPTLNAKMSGSTEIKQLELRHDGISDCLTANGLEGGRTVSPEELRCRTSSMSILAGSKHESMSFEGVRCVTKHSGENHGQPSPISVLEAPFGDDIGASWSPQNASSESPSQLRLLQSSEATTKSPHIEFVSRSLAWDDAIVETPSSYSLVSCSISSLPKAEEEERDQFLFVQMLLSAAGLDQGESDLIFSQWYSQEQPLDPSLLDKCASSEDETQVSNANCRHQRLDRRLDRRFLFDCVNVALVEMMGSASDAKPWVTGSCKRGLPHVSVIHGVWTLIKDWSFDEEIRRCADDSSLVLDRMVGKEVVGRGGEVAMRLEVDGIGNEIENQVMEELVDEAIAEFTFGS